MYYDMFTIISDTAVFGLFDTQYKLTVFDIGRYILCAKPHTVTCIRLITELLVDSVQFYMRFK